MYFVHSRGVGVWRVAGIIYSAVGGECTSWSRNVRIFVPLVWLVFAFGLLLDRTWLTVLPT